MTKFTEKQAAAQYEIISKLSLSEVLDLMIRGYENPISPKSLKQGDTVLYVQGYGLPEVGRNLKDMEGGFLSGINVRTISLFIVSRIYESGKLKKTPVMQYWMYHIKFVSDKVFKEVYTSMATEEDWHHGRVVEPPPKPYHAMLNNIDRPTIVFNIITGEKWICDWKHPYYGYNIKYAPTLHYNSGSGSIFRQDEIVILNLNILSDNFLNWLDVNPLEVKQ